MVPIIITAAVTAVIVAVIVWFVATGIQQSKYKATVGSAEERSRTIIDDALKTAESKKREVLLEAKEENLKGQRYRTPEPGRHGGAAAADRRPPAAGAGLRRAHGRSL